MKAHIYLNDSSTKIANPSKSRRNYLGGSLFPRSLTKITTCQLDNVHDNFRSRKYIFLFTMGVFYIIYVCFSTTSGKLYRVTGKL